MKGFLQALTVFALTRAVLGDGKGPRQKGLKDPKRNNIVFIMSDDQDRRLGSLDHMPILQRELVGKGVEFENQYVASRTTKTIQHRAKSFKSFGTVANCCPARASFLRGQAAHSTNITHVRPPG
jgi:N-acetylglucosamine-6-sulfatase